MLELIYPYLLSVAITIVALLIAALSYYHHRRAEDDYRVRASRLPEATRLEDLNHRVADAQEEMDRLQGELLTARQLIGQQKEADEWLRLNAPRYQELQEQLPLVTAKVEAMQSELAQQTEQRNVVQREVADAEHRRTILQEERKSLEEAVAKRQQELSEVESELVARQAQEAGLRQNVEELSVKAAARERDLAGFQASLQQAENALHEASERLATAQSQVRGHEERLADLRGREQQLTNEINGKTDRLESLNADAEQLAHKGRQKREELEDLETQHDRATREFERASSDLRETQAQLREASEGLSRATAEHGRLKDEIAEMKTHYDALQQRITDSAKVLPPGQQGLEEDKLAELWSPILTDISDRDSTEDETQAISQTAAYLTDLGLYFPERVLRAFHTTLKVADVSPLVVLAGISGTGKSELPRRYAEAMGMHFLNLAVQPRWDSPQDMFGFYNYLENRYRATDLARALVQMDPLGAMNGRGWQCPEGWDLKNSRSEDVLLVLLDEMNLARVEYYFSEFLSRLEIRRGLKNIKDSEERQKAEISLEVGMNQKSAANAHGTNTNGHASTPTMPLFVHTNVLFVGTMNEDESTQTLSDKVVDRANVLRFGRPSRLNRTSVAAGPEQPARHLSYETWASWRRSADQLVGTRADEVGKWIEDLNGAMHQIGRPFAFRTATAIKSYIANYPDPDAYQAAMADQIEFKILPKFRGIDVSQASCRQALRTISTLVESLGDAKLTDAIRQCERQAQAENQFVWQGIDRTEDGE